MEFEGNGAKILVTDVRSAFRLSDSKIKERLVQLESYGIGDLDAIDTDLGQKPAIRLLSLPSGWPVWFDVVEFCAAVDIQIEKFTKELDFSQLDSF